LKKAAVTQAKPTQDTTALNAKVYPPPPLSLLPREGEARGQRRRTIDPGHVDMLVFAEAVEPTASDLCMKK